MPTPMNVCIKSLIFCPSAPRSCGLATACVEAPAVDEEPFQDVRVATHAARAARFIEMRCARRSVVRAVRFGVAAAHVRAPGGSVAGW